MKIAGNILIVVLLLMVFNPGFHGIATAVSPQDHRDQCAILLVDDDNNSPDVSTYYTDALTVMGYTDVTVFDVGGGIGNGPNAATLSSYDVVIWFSGAQSGGSSTPAAGPNSVDEVALASYLDSGGRLFLTSQDYCDDMGLTTFSQNYLGLASMIVNGTIDPLEGEPGNPIGNGLTDVQLTYPDNFIAYPDHVTAVGTADVALRDIFTQPACVNHDGGNWRTVFLSYAWSPIYNHDLVVGRQLLQSILDWLQCYSGPTPTPTITPTETPTPLYTYTPTMTPTDTPTPLPCSILLVDDDDNGPDLRTYYEAGITAAGYSYTVFDVGIGSENGPTAIEMANYDVVVWFSGDKFSFSDPSAGPNAADEIELMTYLDAGGRLFLSSQDYLFDAGLTTFGQNYLGVSSFTNDTIIEPLTGVPGDPIGNSYGTLFCTNPPGFGSFADELEPWAISSSAFTDSQDRTTCLSVDENLWRTVFFTESWTTIYYEDNAIGIDLMQTVLEFLCEAPEPTPSPTVTPEPTATPTGQCFNHGDVNFSGGLSAEDAQITFNIVLGLVTPTVAEECAADCNGNGSVAAGDAQTIFFTVLGMAGGCADPIN